MKLSAKKTVPPGSDRDFRPDQPVRLISLLLVLVTVLVYLPAGFLDFIDLDDPDYVSENGVVQSGLTWTGLKWAFAGSHFCNWHPLTWLSHELDCQLFGLNAGAHHLVNVLFHAANAMLLFRLWLRLTKTIWPSALVAALFAWHPLHVESVAWVAERKDVLSTFFGLLSLLAYARFVEASKVQGPRSKIFYGLSLLAFALALLAKPMLVTLPCVLLLLDYWPLQRLTEKGQSFAEGWRLAREKWPFFLLAALVSFITFTSQHQDAVISLQQLPLGLRLENTVMAAAGYLGKTFWPVNLCIFYPLPRHYATGKLLCSVTTLTILSGLVWHWRWQHRYFMVGWLWFLGMLAPVIGLIQVGAQAMADRYTYLPAVGLFVAAAFGIAEAQTRFRWPARSLSLMAILVLGACVAVMEHQLSFWRNSETLFKHAVAATKNNGAAHMFLGMFYQKQERTDEARQQFHEALECSTMIMMPVAGGESPSQSAHEKLLLGQADEQNGHPDKAMEHYREALQLDPGIVEAHNNLGNLLDELGKSEDALLEYQAAVQLRPELPLVHENLGTQLAKLGRFDDALHEYQAAARAAPEDPQPFYLIGKAWLRRGQSGKAVNAFQNALQLNSNDCPSLVFLARVLAADESTQFRNGPKAVALAEQANNLTGGSQPFVLDTLAMAYAEAGRFDDARKTVRTAIGLTAGGSGNTVSNLQAQLQLYDADRPFRESFANQTPP